MKNKELLRRIDEKDLELLEKYKKIMCKPIQDLMKGLEVLEILKDKEVDINFFKTLIPFHKGEELMMKYNETRWKGKLTLEETIKIKEWLEK